METMLLSRSSGAAIVALILFVLVVDIGGPASASDGGPHPGTWRHWDLVPSALVGNDPHETIADPMGLTGHVGWPANYTSMENLCAGFCGMLFWNQFTNAFKGYCVTGGLQFSGDLDFVGAAGAPFSSGDAWTTVAGNPDYSPYMNFAGTDSFRRWNLNALASTGIRVKQTDGLVYLGNFSSPGELIELDPATNAVRRWDTTCNPYNLVIAPPFVYATCVGFGAEPDQIVRLDPVGNSLKRWPVPGTFQAFLSFGIPNGISQDADGNLWFTQTVTNEVVMLDLSNDCFEEYTKPGMDAPQDVASSGTGASQQTYFTETDTGQKLGVLSVQASTSVTTCVTPTTDPITPASSSASPIDFTITPVFENITPIVTPVMSTNGNAIDRFPLPAGTSNPTAVTEVVFPYTLYGTFEGTDQTYEFTSGIVVGDPLITTNHFKVYDVDQVPFDHPVELEDQFGSLATRAGNVDLFGNPVDKNGEGVLKRDEHQKWYIVTDPDPIARVVELNNQFGDQQLTTGEAQYLVVPTEKNDEGEPGVCTAPQASAGQTCVRHSDCDVTPGDGLCGGLRHFLCYDVIDGQGFGQVNLDDQFGSQTVDVLPPRYFCNPVQKTLPDCCNADLDDDGDVDAADFAILAGCFGGGNIELCDTNCDGLIDLTDQSILACQFGSSPPDPSCCPGAIPPGVYPIADPLAHLTCYDIVPKVDGEIMVSTNDQLDQSMLQIRHNEMLCVPSTKFSVPEPGALLQLFSGTALLGLLAARRRRRSL